MSALVSRERIEQTILVIRGHRVMMDADLAKLYGVTTFNLNKAVKRNSDRFPEDFMFRLSAQETAVLTFQIGISKPRGRGGRRNAPYVFTEQGVALLSSVLPSERQRPCDQGRISVYTLMSLRGMSRRRLPTLKSMASCLKRRAQSLPILMRWTGTIQDIRRTNRVVSA
jgi:hypothetical protein